MLADLVTSPEAARFYLRLLLGNLPFDAERHKQAAEQLETELAGGALPVDAIGKVAEFLNVRLTE